MKTSLFPRLTTRIKMLTGEKRNQANLFIRKNKSVENLLTFRTVVVVVVVWEHKGRRS